MSRYVITGAPGSGKTPVLAELAALGFEVVPEPAREVIAERGPIYDSDPVLFNRLMLERATTDFTAVDRDVFFDRGIPDHIGYHELFGLDASAAWLAAREHRYDLVFVLPGWPEIYTLDEHRRMTFEQAETFGQRIRAIYEELDYQLVDVRRDTPAARASFIATAARRADDRPDG